MARTYKNYLWQQASEHLTMSEIEEAGAQALAGMNALQASCVYDNMQRLLKIDGVGTGSATGMLIALGLWLKEQET